MKLATIEEIKQIKPIDGADKIELASINGWDIVVKKDEYKKEDICIYVCIDTLVDPSFEAFSFLKDKNNSEQWARIKTIKLKGVFSQGLIISTNYLPKNINFNIGDDVSSYLPIKKYEKLDVLVANGTTTHFEPFPTSIIPITDEDNLKTNIKVMEELRNKSVNITLKMDGSSMTVINKNGQFIVCSRRLILDEGAVMYQYTNKEHFKNKLENMNIAIQGEFCGPKINKNQMGLNIYKYYVFTIKNLDTNNYLSYDEMVDICKKLSLDYVPLITKMVITNETIDDLQKLANEVTYNLQNNKKVPGEGIVIRPNQPIYSDNLKKMLSVKIINQNYKD